MMRAVFSHLRVAESSVDCLPVPISAIVARVTGGTVVTTDDTMKPDSLGDSTKPINGRAARKRRRPRLVSVRLVREGPFTGPEGHPAGAGEPPALRSPRDVYAYMAPFAEREPAEVFWILPLDSQNSLNTPGPVVITRGILNASLVHPREVFLAAIKATAAAVILVHNHPSGDPSASLDDRAVTDQLVATGRILDIPVRDHVIIGRGRYYSFAEVGLM